jgi:putative tricarboxylic transport membrane protein
MACSIWWIAAFVFSGCTGGEPAERPVGALEPTASGYPSRPMTLLAPANPGGGWDQTARQIQQVWTETGVLGVPIEVVNRGGAGGTIGLADLVSRQRGNPYTLMVFGQVMVGATRTNDSAVSLDDTVLLARLLNEYEIVAVPTDSPYQTLEQLIQDFRQNPGQISWAGGSAGGIDHILVGLLAQAAGVDPLNINYIAYSGGGEAAVGVMGGHVVAGVSGLGEWRAHVESGRMRLLAISSAERVEGHDTPTIRESGLDVVIANWRAIAAPPGTDEETRAWLIQALTEMRESPAWQDILVANDWQDSFLTGADFEEFVREEERTVEVILRAIGLIQ